MKIFSDIKNRNFEIIAELINHLAKEGPDYTISQLDIEKSYRLIDGSRNEIMSSLLNKYKNEKYNYSLLENLKHKDSGTANPKRDSIRYKLPDERKVCIPAIPTTVELIWLKYIIGHPLSKLLLGDDIVKKLEKQLKDVPDMINERALIIKNIFEDTYYTKIEELKENFDKAAQAIELNKPIICSYRTKNGQIIKDRKIIPYKIEYSIKKGFFYLISYSYNEDPDERRPIKSILKNFLSIEICDEDISDSRIPKEVSNIVDDKKCSSPIVLEIKNINDAPERAFLLFSDFERDSAYDKKTDTFELAIYHYIFEEEEIISRILSLGKYVTVKSPENIRTRVVDTIKKALALY